MRTRCRRAFCLTPIAIGLLFNATRAGGVELSGNLRLWAGPTNSNGLTQDQLDQKYRVELRQVITPYISILAAYRFTGFDTDFETGDEFFRRNQGPELSLFYDRQTFSARFTATDRSIRTTQESQDLDVRRYFADLEWRPLASTRFLLRARDESNTADPALFGRQTEAQYVNFAINHERRHWTGRYGFDWSDVQNNRTGFELEEARHELRGTFVDRWWDDRFSVSLDARGAHISRTEQRQSGIPGDVPVPAAQGLFAVDISPDVGELLPSPGLIDGDFVTPVTPPIDIGGANTFRNIGIDLGISRPITSLEISVDRPSSSTIVWVVYESPDNLNWFPVGGVTTQWDPGFLRYTLRFPETTNRIFKAVNLSGNLGVQVLVTEMRALVSSTQTEDLDDSGPEYWVNVTSNLRPVKRVDLSFLGSVRRDLSLNSIGFGRNRDTQDLGVRARFALRRDLELRLGYRQTDLEETAEPVLKREEYLTNAALEWTPLPTVDVLLSASQRDEDENGAPLASNTNLLLRAYTALLPGLRLISEVSQNSSQVVLDGFDQDSWQWRERLEMMPTPRWSVWLGAFFINYDSSGRSNLTRRTGADLRVSWLATRYLSLTGDWSYGEDDLQDTLTQRYSVAWTPGRKLTASANWQSIESSDVRGTTTGSANLAYRLNRMLEVWSAYSTSETAFLGQQNFTSTSFRLGLNIVF